MTATARIVMRDCSAAVAVLAIYLLTLLVPLHQARAAQDTFDSLGFQSLSGWSLCLARAQDHQSPDSPQPVCPVAGVAKTGMALPFAAAMPGPLAMAVRVSQPVVQEAPPARVHRGGHPARAPPETP